jgi:hypothetical protein
MIVSVYSMHAAEKMYALWPADPKSINRHLSDELSFCTILIPSSSRVFYLQIPYRSEAVYYFCFHSYNFKCYEHAVGPLSHISNNISARLLMPPSTKPF